MKFVLRHLLIGAAVGGLIAAAGGYLILLIYGEDPFGIVALVEGIPGIAIGVGLLVVLGFMIRFGLSRRLSRRWAGRPPRGLPAALRRLASWASYPALPDESFSPVSPPVFPGGRRRKRRRG